MSEIHDISEAETHTMPVMTPKSTDFPMDFGPLIENETDDIAITQLPPERPGRKRRLVWISLILLIILLAGGVFAFQSFKRPTPVAYTQAAATIGNLTVTSSGTGPVQAAAVYNLNFAVSAPITSIAVHVGQQVHQGDVLATLNATSLQDALTQAQNSVNSAQMSVNNAVDSLNNTRTQQNTALDLANITHNNSLAVCNDPTKTAPADQASCIQQANDIYTQAKNQANASISSAQNQVNSAVQQRTSAQEALQIAQDNMQEATLTAPHDGVIESVNGQVGENAGSGGSGANSTAFIVLVDASTLNVAAQINEANIAAIAVNQPATFTVAAYPSQTFRASVTGIDTLGQTTSNVVNYQVDLAVDMQSLQGAHVYPGMTATVNITTQQRIGTLLVPSTALSFATTAIQNGELKASDLRGLFTAPPTGSANGNRGIVVELKNGKLVPVIVTTGLTDGQSTEILSGLNEGDQVVVSQTGGTTTTTGAGGGGGRGGLGGFGGGGFGGGGGRGAGGAGGAGGN